MRALSPPFPFSSRSAVLRGSRIHNILSILERSSACHSPLSSLEVRNGDNLLASCEPHLFLFDKEASFNRATRPSGSLSSSSTRSWFLYESAPGNQLPRVRGNNRKGIRMTGNNDRTRNVDVNSPWILYMGRTLSFFKRLFRS